MARAAVNELHVRNPCTISMQQLKDRSFIQDHA